MTISWQDVGFWLFAMCVVYGSSFLPDILGYAE